MDKTPPLKMKCRVKSEFDIKENHKAASNTLADSKREEMSTASTCLILPALAQLYSVS